MDFGTTFRRTTPVYKTTSGSTSKNERRLKATMATTDAALLATYGEGLTDALISGDPEVDMELLGLNLEGLKKVFITQEQKVAYGVSLNEHVYLPDGTEKEVRPESATSANIALEGVPLRWTGKLITAGAKGNEPLVMSNGDVVYSNDIDFGVTGKEALKEYTPYIDLIVNLDKYGKK